jgi:bacterioferritin
LDIDYRKGIIEMKGNAQLLQALNGLLADEMGAVNQYMVHAEMVEDWGYGKLGKMIETRAIAEMKHAEKLIGRILFLEGIPVVDKLSPIHIGSEVPKMFEYDHGAELGAIKAYNAAIKLAAEVSDNATKEILDSILNDEDAHLDEIEAQQEQIKQMGLPQYLSIQIG